MSGSRFVKKKEQQQQKSGRFQFLGLKLSQQNLCCSIFVASCKTTVPTNQLERELYHQHFAAANRKLTNHNLL